MYVAFNTSHTPKVVELPNWHGRAWQLVADTGKLTPFDILIPDADLAPEEAKQVSTTQMGMCLSKPPPVNVTGH